MKNAPGVAITCDCGALLDESPASTELCRAAADEREPEPPAAVNTHTHTQTYRVILVSTEEMHEYESGGARPAAAVPAPVEDAYVSAPAAGGVRPRTTLLMEMAVEMPLTSVSATALAPEITEDTPGSAIRRRRCGLMDNAPWKLSSDAIYECVYASEPYEIQEQYLY